MKIQYFADFINESKSPKNKSLKIPTESELNRLCKKLLHTELPIGSLYVDYLYVKMNTNHSEGQTVTLGISTESVDAYGDAYDETYYYYRNNKGSLKSNTKDGSHYESDVNDFMKTHFDGLDICSVELSISGYS